MNVNDMTQSKYLAAKDLKDGQSYNEFTLVISGVVSVEMKNQDSGAMETKYVLNFQGADKGMVLNKTNITTLGTLFGDETDAWAGKSVILFAVGTTDKNGNPVMGLRVRGVPVQGAKPKFAAKAPTTAKEQAKVIQQDDNQYDGSDPTPANDGSHGNGGSNDPDRIPFA